MKLLLPLFLFLQTPGTYAPGAEPVQVPLNTPVILRTQLTYKDVLWQDSNLDGLSLTSVEMKVFVFYDTNGNAKLILRSFIPDPTPKPTPDPTPKPDPPAPKPAPAPGRFNIAPFVFLNLSITDKEQIKEFANNFSSTASSAVAVQGKTREQIENELMLKNRASLAKYPTWASYLTLIVTEANKHRNEMRTINDIAELYNEIATGLKSAL